MSLIKGEASIHGVREIVLTPVCNIYKAEEGHAPTYSRRIRFVNLDVSDETHTFELTLFADTEEALTNIVLTTDGP